MTETTTSPDQAVITSLDHLVEYYRQRAENKEDLRVGIEWERFGFFRDTLENVPYLGDRSYLTVLRFLHEHKGWEIEDGQGDYIFTLLRGASRTTVEADGKPEISASPHGSLHDVAAEILQHKSEIDEISAQLGIGWIPLGVQPFHDVYDIPLLPKKRYQMWDKIFPNHHRWMHTYMKALAGTHLNFGYTDEANLIRKTQVLLRLSPLLAAMFANSPLEKGQQGQCLGMRRKKIFTGSPGQERMPTGMLDKDFSLRNWAQWYIDLPVILFQFDQNIEVPKGFTFRKWIEEGYEGRFPTFFDFDQHLKTRWTDLRFRPSYLELRVFDTLPFDLLMASAAFVKGIIFNHRGWEAVEHIAKNWDEPTLHQLHLSGCKDGLQTAVDGTTFLHIARELFSVAEQNLIQSNNKNTNGDDERIFLAPLKQLLDQGISPAHDLLQYWKDDPRRVLEWTEKRELSFIQDISTN